MLGPGILRSGEKFALHSFVMCSTAVGILFAARSIGQLAGPANHSETLIHTVVLVVASYPFQTLFAATAMSSLNRVMPLPACALFGCVLAALPAAAVSPTLSWMLDVMPSRLPVVETREQFFADVSARFPTIFLAFATLGTLLWMMLCYEWWKARLTRGHVPAVGVSEGEPGDADANGAGSTSAEARLVRRLPLGKRGRLLALSAEQHYVRIYTDAGSDLVLMAFSEAIDPLPPSSGMRIHRSHWVSSEAVRAIKANGSSLVVELANGTELPVSRSFSGAVREAFPDRLAPRANEVNQ